MGYYSDVMFRISNDEVEKFEKHYHELYKKRLEKIAMSENKKINFDNEDTLITADVDKETMDTYTQYYWCGVKWYDTFDDIIVFEQCLSEDNEWKINNWCLGIIGESLNDNQIRYGDDCGCECFINIDRTFE